MCQAPPAAAFLDFFSSFSLLLSNQPLRLSRSLRRLHPRSTASTSTRAHPHPPPPAAFHLRLQPSTRGRPPSHLALPEAVRRRSRPHPWLPASASSRLAQPPSLTPLRGSAACRPAGIRGLPTCREPSRSTCTGLDDVVALPPDLGVRQVRLAQVSRVSHLDHLLLLRPSLPSKDVDGASWFHPRGD
jgi:hypothetical protein